MLNKFWSSYGITSRTKINVFNTQTCSPLRFGDMEHFQMRISKPVSLCQPMTQTHSQHFLAKYHLQYRPMDAVRSGYMGL